MDRVIKKKKWTPQRIGLGIVALAFVAFSVYSIALAGRHSSLNVNREKITVSRVEREALDRRHFEQKRAQKKEKHRGR